MKAEPKTNIMVRKRIVLLLFIIFTMQIIIVGRYAWVQTVWSPQLQKWASDQWTSDMPIAAKRGKIYDTKMNPLAISGNVERVDAFLKEVYEAEKKEKNKITREEIAEKIAPIINKTKEYVLSKLNKKLKNGLPMSSVTIVRRIERSQGNKLRDLKLPGIVITEDTKRYYPNGNLLAHVLGNTNVDGDGRSGLELEYNSVLNGIPGRFRGETDARHKEQPFNLATYIPPQNGDDLILTIDESIQLFVEKAIEKGLVDYKAKRVSAIVMDPKTGEILAMANKPDYDPNNPVPKGVKIADAVKLWRNRMVNENFEPGSILKVVTASAALEENIYDDSKRFVCNGSKKVASEKIKCWRPAGHGTQTFAQILQNSCNVGFMIVGEDLKKENLYKYFNSFGFGTKTNVDFPGEEKGILRPVSRVGPVELATEAFGQGIAVTGIQYLTAFAAVANNGVMMEPHFVKRIIRTDEEGNTSVVKEINPKEVKEVISKASATKLRQMLESVVKDGAAKKAYVAGFHIGGKTGTAQKVVGKGYGKNMYISSFAGMAPCNNPRVVVLVSVDEPDPSNYYAGSTAAPLSKLIFQDIFRYLNILTDDKDIIEAKKQEKVEIPEVRGLALNNAQKLLLKNKLNFEVHGEGKLIYDMSPKPGMAVAQSTKIVLYLGNEQNNNMKVTVPEFEGKTKKEITSIATSLGIQIVFSGDGIAVSQDIPTGVDVNKNSTIRLILEQPQD